MTFDVQERGFLFDENPPAPSCHASTLACAGDFLLAAWFAGSAEGAGDVGIWFARRSPDGIWSSPALTASEEGLPHWNPVLYAQGGAVSLYYKAGMDCSIWHTRVIRSLDCGASWEPFRELAPGDEGGRGPVKNKMLRLSDGSLLAPASRELHTWRAFADRSTDGGETFSSSSELFLSDEHAAYLRAAERGEPFLGGDFRGRGLIQPTIWESGDGHVHLLMRSSEGFLYRADSSDYGRTFQRAYKANVPNNNSGVDLVRLPGGEICLLCNPVAKNWGKRSPLSLLISCDNGENFSEAFRLEEGEGEFSYPAVIFESGSLYCTYTWNRKKIAYARIVPRAGAR